jgi:1D-myo-inositol 3-kinase
MDAPHEEEPTEPELLVIGHATRDLLPSGGWRLGGSVTYAALTASRLGTRPAIVTSGTSEVVEALHALLPHCDAIEVVPAAEATSFENIYDGATRRQFLRGRATPLTLDAVPKRWRAAPIVLLAPLAQEVAPEMAGALPGALVAATPQGWLRRWRDDGAVYPGAFEVAPHVLPHLDALILSREDLLPPPGSGISSLSEAEVDAQLAEWARIVPIVVMTRGVRGADLSLDGQPPEAFPGYPAREVDPTGAGDVFTTAFLLRLRESGDPRAAVDFANRVAALSVEADGVHGIPTRAALLARYPELR